MAKKDKIHFQAEDQKETHDDKEWVECWQCGGSLFYGHDCGEDVCCCLHPDDNLLCDICVGLGGWCN